MVRMEGSDGEYGLWGIPVTVLGFRDWMLCLSLYDKSVYGNYKSFLIDICCRRPPPIPKVPFTILLIRVMG